MMMIMMVMVMVMSPPDAPPARKVQDPAILFQEAAAAHPGQASLVCFHKVGLKPRACT